MSKVLVWKLLTDALLCNRDLTMLHNWFVKMLKFSTMNARGACEKLSGAEEVVCFFFFEKKAKF